MSPEVVESIDPEEINRREQVEKNQGAIRLLQSWIDRPDQEQKDDGSLEELKHAIDANRPGQRKHFE